MQIRKFYYFILLLLLVSVNRISFRTMCYVQGTVQTSEYAKVLITGFYTCFSSDSFWSVLIFYGLKNKNKFPM